MNKKQKIIVISCLAIIVISLIIWQLYGGEFFTKSQILVEKKDDLFGWTEKKWVDKFVWGLDLSLLVSGISVFITGILIFLFRNKRPKKELS